MNNLNCTRWHPLSDAAAVAREAADRIRRAARRAIGERDRFRIVLAGGTTPLQTYRHLLHGDMDWSRWEVYFGDERCLSSDDEGRNSFQANDHFLSKVSIPRNHIHPIPAELGNRVAAEEYARLVYRARPFDLVLLGMGEDGHTASLFPGQEHPANAEVVAVHDAPKPPSERVSLGYAALNDARQVLVLVTGEGKREAVARWLAGEDLPISRITGRDGVEVLIDTAAYPD